MIIGVVWCFRVALLVVLVWLVFGLAGWVCGFWLIGLIWGCLLWLLVFIVELWVCGFYGFGFGFV